MNSWCLLRIRKPSQVCRVRCMHSDGGKAWQYSISCMQHLRYHKYFSAFALWWRLLCTLESCIVRQLVSAWHCHPMVSFSFFFCHITCQLTRRGARKCAVTCIRMPSSRNKHCDFTKTTRTILWRREKSYVEWRCSKQVAGELHRWFSFENPKWMAQYLYGSVDYDLSIHIGRPESRIETDMPWYAGPLPFIFTSPDAYFVSATPINCCHSLCLLLTCEWEWSQHLEECNWYFQIYWFITGQQPRFFKR